MLNLFLGFFFMGDLVGLPGKIRQVPHLRWAHWRTLLSPLMTVRLEPTATLVPLSTGREARSEPSDEVLLAAWLVGLDCLPGRSATLLWSWCFEAFFGTKPTLSRPKHIATAWLWRFQQPSTPLEHAYLIFSQRLCF